MSSPNPTDATTTNNKLESETICAPPSISITTDTKDPLEPPLKRMKVDAPAIPHYNSHNIYSKPATPSSKIPIPSLPSIISPISPLDNIPDSDLIFNDTAAIGVIAPLPKPSEEWPLCAYCCKGGDLSRCSSCRQAYYCNRECQVSHWEVHCVICQPGPPQPPPMINNGKPIKRPIIQPKIFAPPAPPYHHTPTSAYRSNNNRNSIKRRSYDLGHDGNKEQYYCEECDRYFKNGQALGGHRSRVHSSRRNGNIDGDSSYTTKRRRPRPSRARHEPTGNGQYVCPHCSREFASGNALGGHISGAHTKKSKRNMNRGYDMDMGMGMRHGYSRPRHPNL
eukprot:304424_1